MTTEIRIAYLRPETIRARLREVPLVFVPVGPLEWHGPHLPLGVDPLNAEHVALNVCRQVGGVVWPTLFWGTERERPPAMLEHLGLNPGDYIVGMDFPANSLPSAYCPEEIFGLIIRETLRQVGRLGARYALVVNGHGAINHQEVLKRLALEFNAATSIQVQIRMAMPRAAVADGSIGHAAGDETSLMMHRIPERVDLAALPPLPAPLRYGDYAIVDGKGFDGQGRPDRTVEDDPRTTASAERGAAFFSTTVREIVDEIQQWTEHSRQGTAR